MFEFKQTHISQVVFALASKYLYRCITQIRSKPAKALKQSLQSFACNW